MILFTIIICFDIDLPKIIDCEQNVNIKFSWEWACPFVPPETHYELIHSRDHFLVAEETKAAPLPQYKHSEFVQKENIVLFPDWYLSAREYY